MNESLDAASSHLPVKGAIPTDELQGEDQEETRFLREMADDAVRFVQSQPWCVKIKKTYFADGIGDVVGIFLVLITIKGFDGDQWLWVFTGDVPPAYLIVGSYKTPRLALKMYIAGLEEWAVAAELGRSLKDLIPIEVPPTPDNISRVRKTSSSLKEIILPSIRDD